jgi:hypothetical protein
VTLVRPVGVAPTGPFSLDRTIGRGAAFACAGVVAALNAQADQIINSLRYQSVDIAVATLGGVGAIIWVAMFVAVKIGLEDERDAIRRRDIIVLLAVAISSLLPVSLAAPAGLLLCGVYLLATSERGSPLRRVSVVLLALTGPLIWGRIFLHVFATPILALDANLVGWLIGSPVNGNTVDFTGASGKFLVGTPCSSVHNISLAIVLWATAAALFSLRIDRKYVLAGLAMAGWMFALNIARLVAVGLFPAHFHFLHVGAGAELFGWAGLIGAAAIAARGVIGAVARQR